jgi:hypothetical protein
VAGEWMGRDDCGRRVFGDPHQGWVGAFYTACNQPAAVLLGAPKQSAVGRRCELDLAEVAGAHSAAGRAGDEVSNVPDVRRIATPPLQLVGDRLRGRVVSGDETCRDDVDKIASVGGDVGGSATAIAPWVDTMSP